MNVRGYTIEPGAILLGAILRGADLPKGMEFVEFEKYNGIVYPDGRVSYGCETLHRDAWPSLVEELANHHEPSNPQTHIGNIKHLLSLCK